MREIFFEVNGTTFLEGNVSLNDILEEYRANFQFIFSRPENLILIGIYIPVFLLALIANILVISIFIKYRSFRTVTNCFVMNLSIADLLVTLICMPAAVGQVIHAAWLFGEFICKVVHYLQAVAVSSSVFTLTAMSVDRFLAIRYPLKRKNLISKRLTMKFVFSIWTIALLLFSPILYVRKTDGYRLLTYDFVFCVEVWPNASSQRIFGILCFTVVYAIPGLVIVITYSLIGCRLCQKQLLPEFEDSPVSTSQRFTRREGQPTQMYSHAVTNLIKERRKIAKTLMILALAFAMCWLPSSCLSLMMDLEVENSKAGNEDAQQGSNFYEKLNQYFILLGHLNSLLNPLLYCLLTRNFRNHVKHCFHTPCFRSWQTPEWIQSKSRNGNEGDITNTIAELELVTY